jgi:hypothetical protein
VSALGPGGASQLLLDEDRVAVNASSCALGTFTRDGRHFAFVRDETVLAGSTGRPELPVLRGTARLRCVALQEGDATSGFAGDDAGIVTQFGPEGERRWFGMQAAVSAIALGGPRIFVADRGGNVATFEGPRQVHQIRAGEGQHVARLVSDREGRHVVAITDIGGVALLDGVTGVFVEVISDQLDDPAISAAFDASGRTLAIGSGRGLVYVLEVRDR